MNQIEPFSIVFIIVFYKLLVINWSVHWFKIFLELSGLVIEDKITHMQLKLL